MRTASSAGRDSSPIVKTILLAAALLIIVVIMQLPAQLNSTLPAQGLSAPRVLLFMTSIGSANTLAP